MELIQEQNYRNLTREQRGQIIAQKYRITRTDKGYEVPSQFNKGKYLVKIRYDKQECNCPDYEVRRQKCKHIFAVEYTMKHYFKKPELTPILAQMVTLTSLPLKSIETKFNIDSTGFGTSNFQRWFSFKHGKDICSRRWVKCHFVNGAKSNIITSVRITPEYDNDCPQLKEMAMETAQNFDMQELSGDKAYLSQDNFELVNNLGGTFYVPFKSNSQASGNGMIWKKMYHYFMLNNDEYLQHYNVRSNAESTVNMIKSKFGDRVRSKLWTAQVNEALCKVICHNICCLIQEMNELGMKSEFCTLSPKIAQ